MKHLFTVSILAILALFSSCSGGEKSQQSEINQEVVQYSESKNSESSTSTTIESSSSSGSFKVLNSSEQEVGSFSLSPSMQIQWGAQTATAKERKEDKRKYYMSDGSFFVEVKFKDDGFKVRTSDGTLLYKVKIKEDKVKVSDNEEGEHAFECKINEGSHFKVKRDEEELAKGSLINEQKTLKMDAKDGAVYLSSSDPISAKMSLGVLGCTEIPLEYRMIILLELQALQK